MTKKKPKNLAGITQVHRVDGKFVCHVVIGVMFLGCPGHDRLADSCRQGCADMKQISSESDRSV